MNENLINKPFEEQIKYLKSNHIPIYSISKLGTLDECYYEYYLTYINKTASIDNIYGVMGSTIHKCLEKIQNGETLNFSKEIEKSYGESKILGIDFPTISIGEKWLADMKDFAQNYKPFTIDKFETEKPFIIEIDGRYYQGFIDLLIYNKDGTIDIMDYKTSSKFTNANLEQKGRQLVLYALAMEEQGFKVRNIAWYMLKYVKISYKLKNGKTRETIAERGFILDKLQKDIKKELINLGYSDADSELLISTAIIQNNFDSLPSSIKDKYKIEEYIVPYELSDYSKTETRMYLNAKAEEVEMFSDKEEYWEPKEINSFNDFYCYNLCGKRNLCSFFQEYKERKEEQQLQQFDGNIIGEDIFN